MTDKTEINKLINLLKERNIPFETANDCWNDSEEINQVFYPNKNNCVCDAVIHSFSYGHESGLLELMGLVDEETVGDIVEGCLRAEEICKRISRDWEFRKSMVQA